MKIFSIILTTSFFLGLPSISSAESVYTITNKSNGRVHVSLDIPRNRPTLLLVDFFNLLPNECVKLTESAFYNLSIFVQSPLGIGFHKSFCYEENRAPCEPDNYEIHNTSIWTSMISNDKYILKTVDQINTSEVCQEQQEL